MKLADVANFCVPYKQSKFSVPPPVNINNRFLFKNDMESYLTGYP